MGVSRDSGAKKHTNKSSRDNRQDASYTFFIETRHLKIGCRDASRPLLISSIHLVAYSTCNKLSLLRIHDNNIIAKLTNYGVQ